MLEELRSYCSDLRVAGAYRTHKCADSEKAEERQ